mmetsp:Transcript_89977/g.205599  ORF Transcript_89977/g.205599 Transcript_89977/m.205599 type:complete len:158 (+) Transcript_89977:501-974(+)
MGNEESVLRATEDFMNMRDLDPDVQRQIHLQRLDATKRDLRRRGGEDTAATLLAQITHNFQSLKREVKLLGTPVMVRRRFGCFVENMAVARSPSAPDCTNVCNSMSQPTRPQPSLLCRCVLVCVQRHIEEISQHLASGSCSVVIEPRFSWRCTNDFF